MPVTGALSPLPVPAPRAQGKGPARPLQVLTHLGHCLVSPGHLSALGLWSAGPFPRGVAAGPWEGGLALLCPHGGSRTGLARA